MTPSDLVVCLGCRTWSNDRIDLKSLRPDRDALVCECGQRYPIVDGVPLVVSDPAALTDAPPSPTLDEHVSIYMDNHWGDHADPPVPLGLIELLGRLPTTRVPLAVDLGCSAGRVASVLAASADRVVAVDLQLGTLRHTRRLLAGEPTQYRRRRTGAHYDPVSVPAQPAPNVTVLCADALDPPLVPRWFDRVVALNLLDSVASPHQLLAVLDGLCAPGGEVIVACPYQWQEDIVHADHWFGPDPAAELHERITTSLSRPYTIEDEADVDWTLRRDARHRVTYRTHYLRARKGT